MPKTSQSYNCGRSTVTIELANILNATTQVIVSSDDDRLTMSGGVSQDLLAAGGDVIREDAHKHLPVAVGQAIVTTAGRLSANHVFHAITRQDGKPQI